MRGKILAVVAFLTGRATGAKIQILGIRNCRCDGKLLSAAAEHDLGVDEVAGDVPPVKVGVTTDAKVPLPIKVEAFDAGRVRCSCGLRGR